jgi:hypothetical protein
MLDSFLARQPIDPALDLFIIDAVLFLCHDATF